MDTTEYVSFRYDTAEVENGQAMCVCMYMALVLMAQLSEQAPVNLRVHGELTYCD